MKEGLFLSKIVVALRMNKRPVNHLQAALIIKTQSKKSPIYFTPTPYANLLNSLPQCSKSSSLSSEQCLALEWVSEV